MKRFRITGVLVALVALSWFVAGLPSKALGAEEGKETKVKQIVVEANEIKNKNPGFEIKLWTEGKKTEFRFKDTITFRFKANKDCYVTLLDIGTDGTVYKIFPNKWHKSSKVKSGKVYTIPPEDAEFRFRVKGPVGIEYVKAIATLDPLKAVSEEKETEEGEEFSEIKAADLAMKNIKVELDKRAEKDWAESVVSFKVKKEADDE